MHVQVIRTLVIQIMWEEFGLKTTTVALETLMEHRVVSNNLLSCTKRHKMSATITGRAANGGRNSEDAGYESDEAARFKSNRPQRWGCRWSIPTSKETEELCIRWSLRKHAPQIFSKVPQRPTQDSCICRGSFSAARKRL